MRQRARIVLKSTIDFINGISDFSEYIEMAESEEDTEQIQTEVDVQNEPTESADEQNKVIVLLNTSPKVRNYSEKSKEIEITAKNVDTARSKMAVKKNLKRVHDPLAEPDKEDVEVDFIVVEENHQKKNGEESDKSSSKKMRPDIEPTTSRTNESSQKSSDEVIIIQSKPAKPQLKLESPLRPKNNIDGIVSSTEAFDANNEETYFALSLLGTLRRLTPHKRAIAKCHILSYLTELEYGSSSIT